MDAVFEQVILGAPNLFVALIALYWLSRKLDKVLDILLVLVQDRIAQQQAEDEEGALSDRQ